MATRRGTWSLSVLGLVGLLAAGCGSVDINVESGREIEGSGELVTENRPVDGFTRVVLAGEGDLTIVEGEAESLTVETDDNIQDHIDTAVVGEALVIETAGGVDIDPTTAPIYQLTVTTLDAVELSGAGSIRMERWSTDEAGVVLAGAGDIDVDDLSAGTVRVVLSGAGSIDLAGAARDQDVVLSGAGGYEAAELETDIATVVVSGAASGAIWTTESLTVRISGTGSLGYYGSPEVDQTVSGVGSVSALGDR